MKRRDLRLERKRQRKEDNKLFILKIAEKIIAQKGYSSTSMDDIAEEAQFSKATLYRYFTSKGKLFFEIIVNSLEELNKKLREKREKSMSADKKLVEAIHVLLEHLEAKENIARIFFMDKFLMEKLQIFVTGDQSKVSLVERKFINKIKNIHKETLSIINEIITSGVKNGEFRRQDPEATAMILESLIYGYYYGRYWQDKSYDLEKGKDLIHSYFFHGIKKKKRFEKET